MPDIKLSREEKKRLEKIDDALDWLFSVSVKEHFNKAGKLQAFADAATEDEKKQQRSLLRAIFNDGVQGMMASVRNYDIFVQAARRVGSDEELGALLPAGKLDAQDADLLEKCEMKSLAAIIRARKP